MTIILKKKVIEVNPDTINFYSEPPNWWWYRKLEKRIKNRQVKNYLKKLAMGRTFYAGNWDLDSYKFNETSWYLKIKNLKDNLYRPELSYWYQAIINEINLKGYYFHKEIKITNKKQAESFFLNYMFNLISSLKKKNFIIEDVNDIPTVLIGRKGELIKSGNGCHRLAILKIFKIQSNFPVRIIGIHKKFSLEKNIKLTCFDDIHNFVKNNYTK